jgi:hypothetical protein
LSYPVVNVRHVIEASEPPAVELPTLRGLADSLAGLEQDVPDAVRIDRLRELEELKSAVAAAQARETAALAIAQQAEQSARSIAAQVGLARRVSPWQAGRYVGWARVLVGELPATFAALQAGRVSEWRAMIVARETIWLSGDHRAIVDQQLATRLDQLGDRQLEAETKKLAYRLDPEGFVARVRGAEADRRVTLRPAPEAMGRLTIFAPIAQAVAAQAALNRDASADITAGDRRSRGQLMADLAIERLTGQASAEAVPVEINLIMTDQTLFDPDCPEPAQLADYGPIPAGIARALALDTGTGTGTGTGSDAPRWLRRLFCHPGTGQLAAMETRRRHFTKAQRHFVKLRDQYCRTPTAAHRSGTSTTSPPPNTADPPPSPTRTATAKHATTPNKPPAGSPTSYPASGTRSRSPPPPATATAVDHRTHQDDHHHQWRNRRRSCYAAPPPLDSGTRPSWRSMPSSSIRPHRSTILSPRTRNTLMPASVSVLPDAGTPMSGPPVCVPLAVNRSTTMSSSATS